MANKTIGQLDTVSSVSAVGSYIELEVGGVSKKAYFMESGTWTPVMYGTTSAGTGTYTTQLGYYSLIGNVCYFTCYLTWSAHTGTGNIRISGLPYTVATGSVHAVASSVYHSSLALAAGYILLAFVNNATDTISLKQSPAGGGSAADVPIDTSAHVLVSGFYFIA